TPAPNSASSAPMTGDLATAASAARRARSMLEQGDLSFASNAVSEALRVLKGVPDSDKGKAPVLADLTTLTQQIDKAEVKVQRGDAQRTGRPGGNRSVQGQGADGRA